MHSVDSRQVRSDAFAASIKEITTAGHRALGLLVIVIVVLLLSQELSTVGTAPIRSRIR